MGRSDIYANEFDLEAEEFVPMPKGDVHKTKEVVQYVSLYDFDAANAVPHGKGGDMFSVMSQILRPTKTEITGCFCSFIHFTFLLHTFRKTSERSGPSCQLIYRIGIYCQYLLNDNCYFLPFEKT